MRKIVVFGVVAILIFTGAFLAARRTVLNPPEQKIKVTASFYVPAEFARQIGGEKIDVVSIAPAGAEPHDYEPTPREISDIYLSKLFIFQGGGFDSWAERLSENLRGRGIAVVSVMDRLAPAGADPHIWLDPVLAQREIEIIRDALIAADPANVARYMQNGSDYLSAVALLDEEYKKGLAQCGQKDFVVSHSAFELLARHFGFTAHSFTGLSPEEEPSPRKIAEIIELVRAKNIKFIFTEPRASSPAAQIAARETGAEIMTLDPVENLTAQEAAAGKNYISLMRENLQNLRQALLCHDS